MPRSFHPAPTESGLGDLPKHSEVAAGGPVALVIEDDPDSMRIAGSMLTHLGYAVRAVGHPNEALHLLMDSSPALMLVDLCLPVMDGVSFIQMVRRMRDLRGLPILAASAVYPFQGKLTRVLAEQGVYAFLPKPYTVASLREAIDFARATALRHGTAPECTMEPGGLFDKEDEELRRARQAREEAARRRGLPKALPPSPSKPARPTVAKPPRPAVAPAPKPEVQAEQTRQQPPPESGPEPVVATESGNPAPSSRTLLEQQTAESPAVRGTMSCGKDEGTVVLEACDSSRITVLVEGANPSDGDPARVEFHFRHLQNDAMEDHSVRLLGTLSKVEGAGSGWRCQLNISAARPVESYYELCRIMDEKTAS
ncbi:MAG: response regulator [Myxococcota bacterium]|nr:response regulator [Myxococcota bacterium]